MDNKLISLASYLKKLSLKENETLENEEMFYYSFYRKANICADFYMQPLNIGMFFPCDENGNYWEYPPTKEEKEWAQKDSTEAELSYKQKEYNYLKAKEKVLFEGFKLDEDGYYAYDSEKDLWIDEEFCEGLTVNDMVQYDLTLTPAALKILKTGIIKKK